MEKLTSELLENTSSLNLILLIFAIGMIYQKFTHIGKILNNGLVSKVERLEKKIVEMDTRCAERTRQHQRREDEEC